MKYRITEVVVYEVEADDPLDAYERVLNTDGGLVDHFHSISHRELSEQDPKTGLWADIDEPESWEA